MTLFLNYRPHRVEEEQRGKSLSCPSSMKYEPNLMPEKGGFFFCEICRFHTFHTKYIVTDVLHFLTVSPKSIYSRKNS